MGPHPALVKSVAVNEPNPGNGQASPVHPGPEGLHPSPESPTGSPWGTQPSVLGAPSASIQAAPFSPPCGQASGLQEDAEDFARNQLLLPALEYLPRGRDDWQPREPITLLTSCEAVHGQPAPPKPSALTQVCAHTHTHMHALHTHTGTCILTHALACTHTCTHVHRGSAEETAGQDPSEHSCWSESPGKHHPEPIPELRCRPQRVSRAAGNHPEIEMILNHCCLGTQRSRNSMRWPKGWAGADDESREDPLATLDLPDGTFPPWQPTRPQALLFWKPCCAGPWPGGSSLACPSP